MLQKIKYLFDHSTTRPVFVIGTGRSGTHWLGYSLGNHPEVRATVEDKPMFNLSTRMALNPALEDKLFKPLVRAYKWQLFKSAPRLYMDKTHPNIWIAEKLLEAFPNALFLGIERNPYATVASMMKHGGVSAWHKRWREFPIPNRFLGITQDLADRYDRIPFASQCAMRWLAHHNRMNELRGTLGDAFLLITYESFAHDTKATVDTLKQFLALKSPVPIPEVKKDSLNKWKHQLSDSELADIQKTVGFSPDSVRD
ncbi:sulfotransferase [Verrucomicrobia bacterium S94]|nr:sulfotransferase [Verrucomicrobia bacterium S94]